MLKKKHDCKSLRFKHHERMVLHYIGMIICFFGFAVCQIEIRELAVRSRPGCRAAGLEEVHQRGEYNSHPAALGTTGGH